MPLQVVDLKSSRAFTPGKIKGNLVCIAALTNSRQAE